MTGHPNSPRGNRFKKAIVVSLLAIAIVDFVVMFIHFYHLMDVSPSSPNPLTGQIYPLNNDDAIVYITRAQDLLQDLMFFAYPIIFIGGFLLNVRWRVIGDGQFSSLAE